MITLKSQREIEAMDRAGDFLASIHIKKPMSCRFRSV